MHRRLLTLVTFLLSSATLSLAHGYVEEADIGGTTYTGWGFYKYPYDPNPPPKIFRPMPGTGPITNYSSIDIQCNGSYDQGSAPAPLEAPVKAGSQITLRWSMWPSSHEGPIITWMAKCAGSCTEYQPADEKVWFKVKEDGRNEDRSWATDLVSKTTGAPYTFTVPESLAPGSYIVRHEIIALHERGYPNQVFPNCFQIKVEGSGTSTGPKDKVAFPGEYTPETPGLVFDKNDPLLTEYPIPGPPVWTGDE